MSVPESLAPIFLVDEAATQLLGDVIAPFLRPGMAVLLYGDLGMGKSTLARAIIRAISPGVGDVPSPTFTLMQSYDLPGGYRCWHVDLYRIEDVHDIQELGLDDILDTNIVLIEWPERLGKPLPAHHMACHFAVAPDGAGRMVTMEFSPSLTALRLQVADAIARAF